MATKSKSRLGRSLGSLINKGGAQNTTPTKASPPKKTTKKATKKAPAKKPKKTPAPEPQVTEEQPFIEIPTSKVDASPYQARMELPEAAIRELAASIDAEGLLQPIVVRKVKDRFELIAGERRLRATQHLKQDTILARIVDSSDASAAVLSLIENLQRENLNPIDEAMGYASLMRDFDLTQEQVAQRVGKARASIANALRLTSLEQEIQGFLAKSMISVGHAKILLGLENPSQRLLLARRIIENGMSVREAEKCVQEMKQRPGLKSIPTTVNNVQDAVIRDLQKQISAHLNTTVAIQHGAKKGKLVINYRGNEDLQRILGRIGYLKKDSAM